jgi:hypothetical protein
LLLQSIKPPSCSSSAGYLSTKCCDKARWKAAYSAVHAELPARRSTAWSERFSAKQGLDFLNFRALNLDEDPEEQMDSGGMQRDLIEATKPYAAVNVAPLAEQAAGGGAA